MLRKFVIYFVRSFSKSMANFEAYFSGIFFIKHKPLISEEYLYTLYHYYIYVNVMILLSLLRLYYHYIWLTRLVMNVYYVGISFPMWFFFNKNSPWMAANWGGEELVGRLMLHSALKYGEKLGVPRHTVCLRGQIQQILNRGGKIFFSSKNSSLLLDIFHLT